MKIYKYPRTQHLTGSSIQRGDEGLETVPLRMLLGRHLVIEEKMDGANSAISFDSDGRLLLQSRGHFLTGGPRETQFALFKTWASIYSPQLWDLLQDRYILYGEWLYAKHTIFYTELPHYFLEFDLFDTLTGEFLSSQRRHHLFNSCPFLHSVRVLYEGEIKRGEDLALLIGRSPFISDQQVDILQAICTDRQLMFERVWQETDQSHLMEGLYLKIEEDGCVQGRYKYVRPSFLQAILDTESHWLDRPIVPNRLATGVKLF